MEIDKKLQKNYDSEVIDLKNEEGQMLKELNIYIVKLMTYLWEEPKLVANILSAADSNEIENLAPLISDNFYENILSQNYIEDNLLYVISLLLKEEIFNIKNIDDYSLFLKDSPCSFLLPQLIKKKDIQTFFKMIITKAVEKLEASCYNKDLIFNLIRIEEDIKRKENPENVNELKKLFLKMKKKKSDIIRNSLDNSEVSASLDEIFEKKDSNKTILFEPKVFKEKYLIKLSKEKIIEEKEKYNNQHKNENEKNDIFYDICLNKIISEENKVDNEGPNILNLNKINKYDNNDFLITLDINQKVKKIYLKNFYHVMENINQIFSNILDNLCFLPYSVKCLCKIISILIKKKFPNINIIEQNKFIGRFFFSKLFLPFFIRPTFEALITNFLISKNTSKNLMIISSILLKLIFGELYSNDYNSEQYTPFNLYFMEKMPEVIKIFNEIQKVNLPNFILKLINDELPEDFKLNYFEENPDEVICHRSICFTLDDINAILRIIGLNKDKYFNDKKNIGLKKTYQKLSSKSSQLVINEINNRQMIRRNLTIREQRSCFTSINIKENFDIKDNKNFLLPKKYYFLISDILVNKKYKKIFDLEQKEPYFRNEELKITQNESEIIQNNIIRVKNSICSLLYNYQLLVKKDFVEGTTVNSKSIFNEIKKYIKLSNYIFDETIPIQWHLNCLIEYFKKIPQKYIENDYELLYDEIENDINESIKLLDFDFISSIHEKINYAKRLRSNYENKKINIKKVKLNEKITDIIEKEAIPIALYFDYNKNILKIEKANINYKQLELMDDFVIEDTKKKCMICKTIKIFTNEFPNLTKYQSWQDIDLFELEKKLLLPEKLQEYYNIIKEHLQKNQRFNEKNINNVENKIIDYIFVKLYDKIFPKEYEKDDKIFRQSVVLSWIEPNHLIQDKKNYVFEGFLPDVNLFLKKLEKKKSPRKKFIYMSKIFESIRNLVKFNGGDIMAGVDDQMPILNYALIKARPLRIYSNCKFMELFIGDRKYKKEDSELIQLISICDYISNISYSKLFNVTKEEYDFKCQEARKNDNYKF